MNKIFIIILLCYPKLIQSKENISSALLVKKIQSNGGGIHEGVLDTFYDFIQNSDIFVDKSLFLKALLCEHQTSPSILITAPSGFGKTTLLKMLAFFLQSEINEYDDKIEKQEETKAYKFFNEGKLINDKNEFNDKPFISKHDELMKKYLGKYPVIYLNFMRLKGSHTYEEFVANFKRIIVEVFREHFYAVTRVCIHACTGYKQMLMTEDIKICSEKDYHEFKKISQKGEISNLEEVIVDLSRILKAFYQNPVVILIDEYESFITKMYTTEGIVVAQDEKQRIEDFYRSFLEETLMNNKYLHKGFLTGILPLYFDNHPSTLNKIQHFRHTDKDFYQFYGFSREEVDKLFEFKKIPHELAEQAYITYDGYHVGNYSNIKIFNTWSIVKFLNLQKIDYYWVYGGGAIIQRRTLMNPCYEDIVINLLAEKCWKYPHFNQLPSSSLADLEAMLTSRDLNDFPVATGEIFVWFLTANGYLTVQEYGNGSVCAKIANIEHRDWISATFFGTTLRYKYPKLAINTLQEIVSNRNKTVDGFIEQYKGILLDDSSGTGMVSYKCELWYQVRFLDIIKKTAMIYNYTFAAAEFSAEKSRRDQSHPDFIMSNSTHGIIVEMRSYTKKKLKEAIDDELLPHGRAFFKNNRAAKLVRLIFMKIRVKSKKISSTNFNYTSLKEIPKNVPSIPCLNIVSL